MTDAYAQDLQKQKVAKLPPVGSIGLFTPGLELIPDSFGAAGESVTAAVTRLQSKLKSLLAAHLVKLILNPDSSRLNVKAVMIREDQKEVVGIVVPVRGPIGKAPPSNRPTQPLPADASKLPLGTRVQFQITNNESRNLYISILVIDPTGEMSVIFPNQWAATDDVMQVGAGKTIQIPDKSDDFVLAAQEPKGVAEVLIIASATPMSKALQSLREVATRGGTNRGPVTPAQPTEVIGSFLDDLNVGTRGPQSVSTGGSSQGVKSIDTSQMAALSITFE